LQQIARRIKRAWSVRIDMRKPVLLLRPQLLPARMLKRDKQPAQDNPEAARGRAELRRAMLAIVLIARA
jgi:hypothetical protein